MTEVPTRRRVTAADIARSLGVSRATVGFVLNDTPGQTISGETRTRVLAEAQRLGYRPHVAAQALARGRSNVILLILPDWPMDYSMRRHLDETSLALDEAGFSLVTMTPHPKGRARPLWETLQPDVVMSMAPLPLEFADAIRATGAATVIPQRLAPSKSDSLAYNRGPRLQVEHLAATGHRSIAIASTSDERLSDLATDRAQLARETAADLGIHVVESAAVDVRSIDEVVDRWMKRGASAVVAYNDDVAALVVGAAVRHGIAVPDQLAVIGHDNTPIAELFVPSLTSINVDTAGLGRYLAALALTAAIGSPAPEAGPETRAVLVRRESA